ncbi:MAG: flagellar hook-basal body complex protein [Rhodospirillaceae bacterium]|jgi:flagellar hook protein FlgE
MSLFGALTSGVSGLIAQSSAMGAISDNITNVSTVGYKNVRVDFQTLVTKQTSSTIFSPGGVQSRPRQDTSVQGLLAATTSQTDVSISGAGFFVVNEANRPGLNDQFLFSRAGGFFQDNEGFLRNTGGFYLQAWPTDQDGQVIPANQNLNISNQNIISTDFLTTVNLSRVGGTANATTNISLGANLPANALPGTENRMDVQFFDSLGNGNNVSFVFDKFDVENQWGMTMDPPQGAAVMNIYDNTLPNPQIYESSGQLEFNVVNDAGNAPRRPADGAQVIIDDITYEFDSDTFASVTAAAGTFSFSTTTITGAAGSFSGLSIGDSVTITGAATGGNNVTATITAIGAGDASITFAGGTLAGGGADAGTPTVTFFNGGAGETATVKRVDVSSNTTLAQDVASLVAKVKASDSDFANVTLPSSGGTVTNNRIAVSAFNSTTVVFRDNGRSNIVVNPAGLLDTTGTVVTKQQNSFTISKQVNDYTEEVYFKFGTAIPADGDTMTINGNIYEFDTGGAVGAGNIAVTRVTAGTVGAQISGTLTNLITAIETTDANFTPNGATAHLAKSNDNSVGLTAANDTLVLRSLKNNPANGTIPAGSYDVVFSAAFASTVTSPDTATGNRTTYASPTTLTIETTRIRTVPAISFTGDGLPQSIAVKDLEVLDFSSGAFDMNDQPTGVGAKLSERIELNLGTLLEANGFTQFGGDFSPVFIQQNGARFGTFAGVNVAENGLVTALFDNGEIRPIFQIPVATFTNLNGLDQKTGNVWSATEPSGDPTLRVADNGPAGQTVQGALEQSTVDIGEEFTKMIVVQRAFSASTKIISTADDMLDELLRTKR